MEQDSEAIQRCLTGDTDSYRVLVERYEREAIAHARAIIGNAEDARDMVQDSFVDAFKALPRFDVTKKFYPWLYVILRNRCCAWLRGQKRQHVVNVEPDSHLLVTSDSHSPAELHDIEGGLLKLSAEFREIIMLKYIDGLTYQGLADRLNIPIGTVMSRLYHARRHLRDILTTQANRSDSCS